MALPETFLVELRARTPLIPLIGRKVRLQKSGREHKGCCPFHGERTPSFHVYAEHFHCFGCGAHGDAISFVMQSDRLEFKEAVDRLAADAGLEVPKGREAAEFDQRRRSLHAILEAAAVHFQTMLWMPAGATALDVLKRRGLTHETIKAFRLGWAPRDALQAPGLTPEQAIEAGLAIPRDDGTAQPLFFARIMFPIINQRGRVCGFSGRTLGEGKPKYVNGSDTALWSKSSSLYGLDRARAAVDAGQPLVVVEGQLDVISAHQAGHTGAVAPLGTALTAEHLAALWKLSPAPILCFDGDEAGRRATARVIDLALPLISPDRTLRFARLPQDEDPDSLIRKSGGESFGRVILGADHFITALYDGLKTEDQTPEGRAGFRDRLDAAAKRVLGNLRWEFKNDLRERYFKELRAGKTTVARMPPPPKPSQSDHAKWIANVSVDIEEAARTFADDPTEATQRRLIALCAERERMMRGEIELLIGENDDE